MDYRASVICLETIKERLGSSLVAIIVIVAGGSKMSSIPDRDEFWVAIGGIMKEKKRLIYMEFPFVHKQLRVTFCEQ